MLRSDQSEMFIIPQRCCILQYDWSEDDVDDYFCTSGSDKRVCCNSNHNILLMCLCRNIIVSVLTSYTGTSLTPYDLRLIINIIKCAVILLNFTNILGEGL